MTTDPGTVVGLELFTPHPGDDVDALGYLFGWTSRPSGADHTVLRSAAGPTAVVLPCPPGQRPYVLTDDVAAAAARAGEAGGHLVSSDLVDRVGRCSVVATPTGEEVGLWELDASGPTRALADVAMLVALGRHASLTVDFFNHVVQPRAAGPSPAHPDLRWPGSDGWLPVWSHPDPPRVLARAVQRHLIGHAFERPGQRAAAVHLPSRVLAGALSLGGTDG